VCPGRHRCGPHPRGRHWVVLALVVLAVLAGRGTTCVGTPSIPVQVTINTTEAVSAPRTTAVTTTVTTTPRIGHGASLAHRRSDDSRETQRFGNAADSFYAAASRHGRVREPNEFHCRSLRILSPIGEPPTVPPGQFTACGGQFGRALPVRIHPF